MLLILILGCLVTIDIATNDDLSSADKFGMVIVLGIIMGIISLFV